MAETPVGYRCPDCARVQPNPLLTLSSDQSLKAAGAAIGMAFAGGVGWALVDGLGLFGGFLSIMAALGIGYAISEAISSVSNRKQTTQLQVMAGASALFAYLIGNVLTMIVWDDLAFSQAAGHAYADSYHTILRTYSVTVWGVLSGLLSVGMAVSRFR